MCVCVCVYVLGGGSGWGTHVNPWPIHVNVWQKPLQYYKVISLQLIKKIKEKKVCVCARTHMCALTHVQLFATPWTVANQAPLSIGFPRQEYWSGSPFPTPRDLPDPEMEPTSLSAPALAGGFFTTVPPGKP